MSVTIEDAQREYAEFEIKYSELRAATLNFQRILGTGAFATVYEGVLNGVKVAVKVRIRALEGDGRARDDGCRTIRERDAPRCFVDDSALERARIAGKVTRVSRISSDARRLTRERALERALEPDR